MATIKRNGNLIVLKSGKVSCTCCGQEGCCMYPAEGFGTVDDLPDSINYTDPFTSFTLTKVEPFDYGGMLVYYVADLDLEQYIGIPYEAIFDPGDCQNPEQTLGWDGGPGVGAFSSSCCLIQGLSAPPAYITDNFANTYSVSLDESSANATRSSLCNWCGFFEDEIEPDFIIFYYIGSNPICPNIQPLIDPPDSIPKYTWYFTRTGFDIYQKQGNQNSPAGTYSAMNSVGTITVS